MAVGAGQREGIKRAEALVHAEADVIVVDTAHGHSERVINTVRERKALYLAAHIGENVATAAGAIALIEAGVDAVKVGIGSGSICTIRIVTGVVIPYQLLILIANIKT
ncbi:IMP dehydrogenase / GMP reductase domain protein [Anaplasma phagocytophilum str. ApNP]|uniref:IMP dehydrogenase / GMP reductase domain protein n=1 Tax=Anaplasma phagocytophilum str. ApNP TaxID=1359153 RepID=A0A0F3NIR0_ANAPH|nr:IMP dehydrogenase / GMP reductase domain protein [Anaplasma phagocytophilum str. ApNP]